MEYKRNSGRPKPANRLRKFTLPPNSNRYSTMDFIKAIKGTRGIKNRIAKRLKCSRPTVDKYLKENEEIYKFWLSEKNNALDVIEFNLYTLAEKKDLAAIKYILGTQAKDRGYGDIQNLKVEQTGIIEHNHKHQIELKPDANRREALLDILEACGGLNKMKKLTKEDVEVISA